MYCRGAISEALCNDVIIHIQRCTASVGDAELTATRLVSNNELVGVTKINEAPDPDEIPNVALNAATMASTIWCYC